MREDCLGKTEEMKEDHLGKTEVGMLRRWARPGARYSFVNSFNCSIKMSGVVYCMINYIYLGEFTTKI